MIPAMPMGPGESEESPFSPPNFLPTPNSHRGQIFDDESGDGDSASGEVDFERLAIDFRSIDADKSFLRIFRLRKTNET